MASIYGLIIPSPELTGDVGIEILAPCPTGFGKGNEQREATDSWQWYKDNTITRADLAQMPPEERAANRKIVIGTLWQAEKPEYSARWKELVDRLQAEDEARA